MTSGVRCLSCDLRPGDFNWTPSDVSSDGAQRLPPLGHVHQRIATVDATAAAAVC